MYQCPNCGGQLRFDIPSQQLACEQCSSHFDPYSVTKEKDAEEDNFYEATVFKCPQCGGEILSSDNTAANFCSFCGASTVLTQHMRKEKMPGYIIPFAKTKDDCKKAYSKFMSHAWFAPKELKDERYIDGFRGIYMPYWAYHITEKGHISLDGSNSHRNGDYIITDHYAFSGELNSSYKGISYDASSSFDDNLSASIAPFNVKNMNRFTPSYLTGFYADTADVDPKVYEPEAKHLAASETYKFLSNHPAKRVFKLDDSESLVESKLNPQCEKVDGAMFPVWFLSYRNRNRVAYATVNGQTGKVVADMPVSVSKYLVSSLILAIPIFLILNAIFTFIPSVTLSISSLLASLVPFLFSAQLKQIIKKDEADFDTPADSGNVISALKKGKKKKSGGGGSLFVTFILYFIIGVGCYFFTESSSSLGIILTFVALVMGVIGTIVSLKPFRDVGGHGVNRTLFTLITLIIAAAVQFLKPVSDVYYYAATVLNMLAVLVVLVGLIEYYNVLATRKLPQFDNYRGGDDRA